MTHPAHDQDAELQPGESAAEKRLGLVVAGNYRLVRHIGSGGSSHVFEAEHVRLGQSFALKLLRSELDATRSSAQRFRREARAIARLKHENIVSVVDCGELDDQTPYLVMELLPGEDLRRLLDRESQLSARRAVHIVVEACRGVSAVHEAGLVHRDLKPENLFIARRSSGEDWCKVLDFGVAKMEASLSTAQGAIVGTVRYMAPEQLADSAAVDPRSDVYALAAIFYECVSGRPLHDGTAVQEVMYSVMNREPKSLLELHPGLPPALSALVARSTAKDPAQRPATTLELAELLLAACSMPLSSSRAVTVAEEQAPLLTPLLARAKPDKRRQALWLFPAGAAAGFLVAWLLRAEPVNEHSTGTAPPAPAPIARAELPVAGPAVPVPPATVQAAEPVSSVGRQTAAAPRKKSATGSSPPAAASSRASHGEVGRFDQANPYGE